MELNKLECQIKVVITFTTYLIKTIIYYSKLVGTYYYRYLVGS